MIIKNVNVIEHFTNTELDESHTFGEYYVEYEGGRKILILRNDNNWCALSHFLNQPISECICTLRNDRIEELKSWLTDHKYN